MRESGGLRLRKCVTWVAIVGAHVLLIEVLTRSAKQHVPAQRADEPRGIMYLFELPAAAEEPPPEKAVRRPREDSSPRENPTASTAITLPEQPAPDKSAGDWYAEAEQAAHAEAEKWLEPKTRTFGEQPRSPFRKEKRKPEFKWEPEPKRAGFAGPLPYLRLGKRCILIPPFIGCAFGSESPTKVPTLDDIRDPDRPRSSVPDPNE